MKNNHHLVPISLLGVDADRNIIRINYGVHKELHRILDIPGRKYSQMQRKAKKITNGKIITPPEGVEAWGDMQREFFLNLHKLPTRLQKEHIKKMMEMMSYDYGAYNKLTGNHLDRPQRKRNNKEQFNELHERSLLAQKEISKELIKTIKYYITNKNGTHEKHRK